MPPSTATRDERDVPLLEARDIVKTYPGGVMANDGVSLRVHAGEVHCLLGENGAGKSTLIQILAGSRSPDSGLLLVDGQTVSFDSPRAAIRSGVGAVFQHPTSAPTLTVLENMMLGEGRGLRLDPVAARAALARYGDMLGVSFDPDALVGRLALGRRQQLEIAKALSAGSRVLVLDEPTAMLTPAGTAELFETLGGLKARGLAVVFVTHKLGEALEVGDRITVLRHGHVTGSWDRPAMTEAGRDLTYERVIVAMFGASDPAVVAGAARAADDKDADGRAAFGGRDAAFSIGGPHGAPSASPALDVEGLCVEPHPGEIGVRDVSFAVMPGEIVGVAGVDGNGQRELAEALAGQRPAAAGDIRVSGYSVVREGVADRLRRGLRYVTDDRTGEGTVASLSVALNLLLKRIGERPFWRRGRMDAAGIDENARDLMRRFDILAPGPSTACRALSGGNLQKVVLARELSSEPAVVIYSKPTYGLDVRTAEAVHGRIRELAGRGAATVLISADLDEVLALSDRIAVMSGGTITGIVENGPAAALAVGGLMVGPS